MQPYWQCDSATIYQGHVLDVLRALEPESVQCIVTSPPYWGLRDYSLPPVEWPAVSYAPMAGLPKFHLSGCDPNCNHEWGEHQIVHQRGYRGEQSTLDGRQPADGEDRQQSADLGQWCQLCDGWRGSLGLEPTVEMFVGHIVLVARELWRVLRNDGTFWLNLGDSYVSSPQTDNYADPKAPRRSPDNRCRTNTLKPKNKVAIPWRVALALQADGWYLRSDVIWEKPNAMPESVRDRPTQSHEYLFLLTKSQHYYYDNNAIREPQTGNAHSRGKGSTPKSAVPGSGIKANVSLHTAISKYTVVPGGRNRRTVWRIPTQPYSKAHYAVFPNALVAPCIKAGTSAYDVCPTCGAPWKRVTRKTNKIDTRAKGSRFDKGKTAVNGEGRAQKGERYLSRTIGWRPTCVCYDHLYRADLPQARNPRKRHQRQASGNWWKRARRRPGLSHWPAEPCTVLDPFCGSGTTIVEAIRLRRHGVGIELSQEYCDEHIIPRLQAPIQPQLF